MYYIRKATPKFPPVEKPLSHDAMSHDAMSHDATSNDAMSHDTASHDLESHDKENLIPTDSTGDYKLLKELTPPLSANISDNLKDESVEAPPLTTPTNSNIKSERPLSSHQSSLMSFLKTPPTTVEQERTETTPPAPPPLLSSADKWEEISVSLPELTPLQELQRKFLKQIKPAKKNKTLSNKDAAGMSGCGQWVWFNC